jgi:spore coat polysaccharide biosynthesis predicted glycosyltransferase SpsG
MVIFRADLSPQTGLSHLRRCVLLASLLKKNGGALIRSHEDKRTAKFLAAQNIPSALGKDPGAMDLAGVTAVIFDLPRFSAPDIALLEKVKKAGVKSIQIVPADGACQATDIRIFPFPGRAPAAVAGTALMAGAEFALLHHKFRHFNRARRKYHKSIKHIFINLGDLLPYRDLRLVVDSLHRLHLQMKIAPGLNLKKADKRNLMKIYPGIHFCGKSESPARAYFEADLALIPAGEEALEAAAVGTPALYVSPDKRQEADAGFCSGMGTGVESPSLADFSVQTVSAAMAPLTQERREQMGVAGKKLVDGLGIQRFLKILKENGVIA